MRYGIYQTETFKKWLHEVKDAQAKARVLSQITMIEADGHFGDHRNLGDDLHELRIFIGQGYRVYYTTCRDVILLLAGGIKNIQQADIKKAKKNIGKPYYRTTRLKNLYRTTRRTYHESNACYDRKSHRV